MRKLKLILATLALIFGWSNASAYQTPVANGIYYLYNTACTDGTPGFMSTGNDYGFQVVIDKFGFPVKLIDAGDGKFKFQFIHHNGYLSDNGWMYSDGGDDTDRPRVIEIQDQGSGNYRLFNTNNSLWIEDWYTNVVGDGTEKRHNYIWQFLSKDERDAIVAGYTTSVKLAAATSMGMPASVDTESEFDEYLSTNYVGIDQSSKITNGTFDTNHITTDWSTTANANRDFNIKWGHEEGTQNTPEVFQGAGYLTHTTITVDKVGLYKVSANALYRCGYNDNNNRIGELGYDGSVAYLQANRNFAKIDDWYSGKINGNGPTGPTDANNNYFSQGKYLTEVYVYVDDTKTIDISLHSHAFTWGGWLIFNNFKLTYYGPVAEDADYTALQAAINAAEAKTLGFENGEYAPYSNVDALKALADAKAIDQKAPNAKTVVNNATSALTGATWTANDGEVNAIYNGDFALSENDGAQVGWQTDHSAGLGGAYHARAFVLKSGDSNYDYLAAFGQGDGTRSCSYFRFDETNSAKTTKYTYGATTGYTMPLKTSTIYKLTAQAGGWGQVDKNFKIAVVSSTDANVVAQTLKTPATGVHEGGNVINYEMYFVVPTAGDYKMVLTNPDDVVNAIAISNIELFSTDALEFADGSVPTYAPGTYPTVKITRTLTANRWATAIYPFAVSGVDYLAVFDRYNDATEVMGFSSAAASTANEPFLMKSIEGTSEITLSHVAVEAINATDMTYGNASLKGVYATTTVQESDNAYVISGNEIRPASETGATVNPYRAYIQVTGTGARSLSFVIDDEETTAIDGIETVKNGNMKVYNLNGQRVEKPGKGLYIVNGKKLLVK